MGVCNVKAHGVMVGVCAHDHKIVSQLLTSCNLVLEQGTLFRFISIQLKMRIN